MEPLVEMETVVADFLFETTVAEKQLTEITRTAQFAWTVTACLDPCSTLSSLLGLSNLPSTHPVRDSYSRLLAMHLFWYIQFLHHL
jgi:hypothetical protein